MIKIGAFFLVVTLNLTLSVLCAQDKPQLVVTTGHHHSILAVEISPNGQYLVSSDQNKCIKIYDTKMKQEFGTFYGLKSSASLLRFIDNGKKIVSMSREEIITWEFPSGKIIHKHSIEDLSSVQISEVAVSSKGKCFISQSGDPLVIFDALSGGREEKAKIEIRNCIYIEEKDVLVGLNFDEAVDGESLFFYKAETGDLLGKAEIKERALVKYDISSDGKLIALQTSPGKINIYNTETFTLIKSLTPDATLLNILKFLPEGNQLVVGSFYGCKIIDLNTGALVKQLDASLLNNKPADPLNMANGFTAITFSPNKKMAVLAYEAFLDGKKTFRAGFYSIPDFKLLNAFDGLEKRVLDIEINEDETRLAFCSFSPPFGTRIWDLKKGEVESFYEGAARVIAMCNQLLVHHLQPQNITFKRFDFANMKLLSNIPKEAATDYAFSPDGKYIAYKQVFVKGNTIDQQLSVVELETGKTTYTRKIDVMDQEREFDFLPNGMFMLYYRSKIVMLDPKNGKVIKESPFKSNVAYLRNNLYTLDSKYLVHAESVDETVTINYLDVSTGRDSVMFTINKLALPQKIEFNANQTILAVSLLDFSDQQPNKVFLYQWPSGTEITSIVNAEAMVTNLKFGAKTGTLYTCDDNGVISLWNPGTWDKKASLLTFYKTDHMIITPDNYYKTSRSSINDIGFRYKDKLYRFDQFDLAQNRPDLVFKQLGLLSASHIQMYEEAYQKRLKRLGFNKENLPGSIGQTPEVTIINNNQLQSITNADKMQLKIKAYDPEGNLNRLMVYQNGVPIHGKNGIKLNGQSAEKSVDLKLCAGSNRIAVSAINNKGVESLQESIVVDCNVAFEKPDLYVLAIGVKAYKDSSMNLTYPDKDVQDLTELFNAGNKTRQQYKNVYVKCLTNAQATVANITEAGKLFTTSKVNDQVVLFFSGHGLLDEKLDYYLATHDVDFVSPAAKGLSYDQFYGLIDSIPALKRLVLIDACHSGEIDKDEAEPVVTSFAQGNEKVQQKDIQFKGKKVIGLKNSAGLMKELFTDLKKESGATVIASSAGQEFSVESTEWKNGAFTYALKQGLVSMAADGDGNKQVDITEVRDYVINKVKALTGGKQNPVARQENIEFNYRLW